MGDPRQSAARKILVWIAGAAALVVPLFLLLQPATHFPGDASNHRWMIGYYGDYFRAHGTLPTTMNTPAGVGLAQPVFYAWLFYPMLGISSAGVGVATTLRLAALIMLAIQFAALWSASRKILGQGRLALVVSVSVIWGTYSLTNLYNRGALAEYFAAGFFTTAVAFGASAAVDTGRSARWFHRWLAIFFLVLTAGTHAPTALLAAAFVMLLAVGAIATGRPKIVRVGWGRTGLALAGALVVGVVILAPWLYANHLFASQLALVRAGGELIFRPENCDTFFGRFAPFPFDAASFADGTNALGTAYLEAPVNFVLLGMLLWNLELASRLRMRTSTSPAGNLLGRVTLALACAWFLFLAALSLSPGFAHVFRFVAPYVQYAYRLVSHCNVALLVAVLASGAGVARKGGYQQFQRHTNWVAAIGLAIALVGLGIKLQHAAVVITPANDRPASVVRRQREVVPDYTLPGLARELSEPDLRESVEIAFPTSQARNDFGETAPVKVELDRAGWVRTNAAAFPWTELRVDGKLSAPGELGRAGPFLAIALPPGDHEIRAEWHPNQTWSVLNRVSQALFLLALAGTLTWAAVRWRARRGEVKST